MQMAHPTHFICQVIIPVQRGEQPRILAQLLIDKMSGDVSGLEVFLPLKELH